MITSVGLIALLAMLVQPPVVRQDTGQAGPPSPACSAPGYRQFDFWLGDWDVVDSTGKPAGTNRIEKQFGIKVERGDYPILEQWVLERRGHLQPPYERYATASLPVSEQAAGEILSLPLFPHITESQIERVCSSLEEHVNG